MSGFTQDNFILCQLHIFEQYLQVHFQNAALVLLRAVLTLREVTEKEGGSERETVHIFARHSPNHLFLHQLRTLRFGFACRVDDRNAHQLQELLAVILCVKGSGETHNVGGIHVYRSLTQLFDFFFISRLLRLLQLLLGLLSVRFSSLQLDVIHTSHFKPRSASSLGAFPQTRRRASNRLPSS